LKNIENMVEYTIPYQGALPVFNLKWIKKLLYLI
jgi:hypothetical protein